MKDYLNENGLETVFEREYNQNKKFEESKREYNIWKKEQEEITKKIDESFKAGFDYAKRLYEPKEGHKIPMLDTFKDYKKIDLD